MSAAAHNARRLAALAGAALTAGAAPTPAPRTPDPRDIANGWEIPSEGYCDQPYVVRTHDGAWLCVNAAGTHELIVVNVKEMQKRLAESPKPAEIVNDLAFLYGANKKNDPHATKARAYAEHPAIRPHPITGRKAIFVDRLMTHHLVDVPEKESEAVLEQLYAQAHSPEVQCRVKWREGDLVFFDNRCTQHYAVPDYTERRVMHRVTIKGDRPT